MADIFATIAKQVWQGAKAAKLYKPATLIKVTPGTRTPGNVAGGTNPTTANFAASGFVDDFGAAEIDGTIIIVGDRKISLYGASIASSQSPQPDDKITIAGATYRVMSVASDPANALYVCHSRGAATP